MVCKVTASKASASSQLVFMMSPNPAVNRLACPNFPQNEVICRASQLWLTDAGHISGARGMAFGHHAKPDLMPCQVMVEALGPCALPGCQAQALCQCIWFSSAVGLLGWKISVGLNI